MGRARKLAPEEMLTIEPRPCSIMGAAPSRDMNQAPLRFWLTIAVPLLARPGFGRLVDAAAGVVHQDVDAAELAEGGGDQGLARALVGHVGGHDKRLPAEAADRLGRFLQQLGPAPGQDEVGPVLGEHPRRGPPDPGPSCRSRSPPGRRVRTLRLSSPTPSRRWRSGSFPRPPPRLTADAPPREAPQPSRRGAQKRRSRAASMAGSRRWGRRSAR